MADYVIDEAPLATGIVEPMRQFPRANVPDMRDRMVAATGVYFGVPVISRDSSIGASVGSPLDLIRRISSFRRS